MRARAGFEADPRSSPYLDLIGPVFVQQAGGGRLVVGLVVESRHLNGRGTLHGGVLPALADVALGRQAALQSDPPSRLVTVSLLTHFIEPVRVDDWLEVTTTSSGRARTKVFAQGAATVEGRVVAMFDAVFTRS